MTTENSLSKLTIPASSLKQQHGKVDILKELFKCVNDGNYHELSRLLDENELADKSINISLGRAFGHYSPKNKESKEAIRVLLDHKANPNLNLDQNVKHAIKERKSTHGIPIFISGLMYAAMEGDTYLVQILISHECNLNLTDHNIRNALFYAIEQIQSSNENREKENYKTTSPYYETINLLISSGININQIDREGQSPLTLSILKCEKEIVRILLNNNADVNHQVPKDGNTPLHYAVNINRIDLIQMLLLRKPDLSIKNKNGQTPMEIATGLSRTEIYQILAEEYNLREKENLNKKEDAVTLTLGNSSKSISQPQKGSQSIQIGQSNQNYLNSFSGRSNLQNNLSKSPTTQENYTGLSVNENLHAKLNENLSSEDQINNDEENSVSSKMNNMYLNAKFMSQVGQNITNNQYSSAPVSNQNLNMNLPMNNQQFNISNSGNYHQQQSKMQMMNSHMQLSNLGNYHSQFTTQGLQGQPNTSAHQIQSQQITSPKFSQINNLHSQGPNINININNLTHHNNITTSRTGIPFTQKFTKHAKLQKLRYLQESRQFAEQHGRTIKDKTFRFPSSNVGTNIEIPFSFQTNPDGGLSNVSNDQAPKSQKTTSNQQLHTFIKIQSTPVLHIDISDESKQDHFILSSQIEELKMNGNNQTKRIGQLELDLNSTVEENNSLKNEILRLKEELSNKEKIINKISIDFGTKESELSSQIEDLLKKRKDDNKNYLDLLNKHEVLEKEFSELTKECYSKYLAEARTSLETKEIPKKEFLEKKFSCLKYDEKYIIKCLQRDIVDFQEYTKEQIKKAKATQEELIKLIQEAVNDCMPDYEVKLYGSHATNLCLQWSDLDVVLIHKKNFNATNYNALQSLYISLLEKPWKKQIKLIDSAVVPLIKMTSSDIYNNMHIDISLQDNKHYGLKCVELVKSFMKEYEALEPLIFALKNILKNANLNDPYTGGLSSYGLILMVVSFLQSQQENKKPIKVTDGNLGRMFLEFLWYYGLMFDHSKYVIYAYPTNEVGVDKDSMSFLFNMQSSHDLIIVDPLSKNNNVARSTYQFVNIKMAFMIGFVVSHEECECGCHYNKHADEGNVYNTDHCILKRIFNSVKRFNASTPSG